jgi:hypothetical protein
LLCLATARSGGASQIVSGHSVYQVDPPQSHGLRGLSRAGTSAALRALVAAALTFLQPNSPECGAFATVESASCSRIRQYVGHSQQSKPRILTNSATRSGPRPVCPIRRFHRPLTQP